MRGRFGVAICFWLAWVARAQRHLTLCFVFFVSLYCSETFTLCGTPEYTAPEVFRMIGHSTCCDWWSVGVLMHELSVGIPPFQGSHTMEIMESIAGYERLYPDSIYLRDTEDELNRITVASEKLIKAFLCPKPYARLGRESHSNSNAIRKHPFFNGFNWKSLRARTMNSPFTPSIASKYDGHNFNENENEEGRSRNNSCVSNASSKSRTSDTATGVALVEDRKVLGEQHEHHVNMGALKWVTDFLGARRTM